MRWASIGAIQLQGCRAAQAFARARRVVVSLSARWPKLCGQRKAPTARAEALGGGWAVVICSIVCVSRAIFNPYDAAKHCER